MKGYAEYDVSSVRKLRDSGKKMHSDYSVLKHVDIHKIILVTRDTENILACEENEMPFVKAGEKPDPKDIVRKIHEIQKSLQ